MRDDPSRRTSECRQNVHKPRRAGSTLILTLIAILLLSFSAYSFSELMLLEMEAGQGAHRQRQLRLAAESGLEAVAASFDASATHASSPASTIESWDRVPVAPDIPHAGKFSITRDADSLPGTGVNIHDWTGLIDESAKLNLNALPLEKHNRKLARGMLLALPGADYFLADAILDWMDADDEPSEFGAESDWYRAQSSSTLPRQGRFESLDELLLVRGVTEELLYGKVRDRVRRNAPLHPPRAIPSFSQDLPLVPERGWSELITLTSWESDRSRAGLAKINVNHPNLSALYDALERAFDPAVARFVVAWRLNGDVDGVEAQRNTSGSPGDKEDQESRMEAARRRAARQQAAGSNDAPQDSPAESRGGLDLRRKPAYVIRSIWDLVGSKVRIDVNRQDTVLTSPWSVDRDRLEQTMVQLENRLTVTDEELIAGRINILRASRPVLLAVPGWSQEVVDAILRSRQSRQHATEPKSLAWLLNDRLLDLRGLRRAAPYLTTAGAVRRGISWGHADDHALSIGIEFVIDGAHTPARFLELREREPVSLMRTLRKGSL